MNNLGTKRIETNRLVLRKLVETDADYIFNNWANDDRVTERLTWTSHENIEVTKEILSKWLDDYNKDHTYRSYI